MAEYIEREAVVKFLRGREGDFVNDIRNTWSAGMEAAASWCEKFPAAEVAPVVHGRWEWREEWETHHETHSIDLISCGWYCTECGIELGEYLSKKTGLHIILDDDSRKPELTNCPNCGATMDAEGGEG